MIFKTWILLITSSIKVTGVLSRTQAYHHNEKIEERIQMMSPNPLPYRVQYDNGIESPEIRLMIEGQIGSSSAVIYEETLDGYTVELRDTMYEFVDVDDDTGEYIYTGLVAGMDDPDSKVRKNAAMKRYQILNNNKTMSSGDTRFLEYKNKRRLQTALTTGLVNNLVIPFRFADHTDRPLPSRKDLRTLMNNDGVDPELCPTGSVRDVYKANSYNQLDVTSTVVSWVTIDFTESYCANGVSAGDYQFLDCIVNALDKAIARGIDLRMFDDNNDNVIDSITFFHSGYGAEFGGQDSYGTSFQSRIWSHKWALYNKNWKHNGVKVFDYNVNSALWGKEGSSIGHIGVVAHEIGHFFGLPDLYDLGNDIYGTGAGLGSWDLMGNAWGFDNSQYYPPLLSAWSKVELGWVIPTIVKSQGTYTLSQACDNAEVIKIAKGFPKGEYLLIENRQSCSFDTKVPQGGLAVFHVDENIIDDYGIGVRGYPGQSRWPNNGNHYKIALLQADAKYDLEKFRNLGDQTDLFHADYVDSIGPNGIKGSFNEELYPNTDSYMNGIIKHTGISIYNIGRSSSKMTFDILFPTKSPTLTPTDVPSPTPIISPPTSGFIIYTQRMNIKRGSTSSTNTSLLRNTDVTQAITLKPDRKKLVADFVFQRLPSSLDLSTMSSIQFNANILAPPESESKVTVKILNYATQKWQWLCNSKGKNPSEFNVWTKKVSDAASISEYQSSKGLIRIRITMTSRNGEVVVNSLALTIV